MEVNKIYLGDCLTVMRQKIKPCSIDAVIADLPYGTTRNRWDSVIDLKRLWVEYNRVVKPSGVVILFAQTPFDKVLGASNIKDLRYEWIWEKTQASGHLNAKKMPMKAHENILVFYKKLPTYNPIKTKGHTRKVSSAKHKRNSSFSTNYGKADTLTSYDSVERYPRSVLKFASDRQKCNLHPTQKPIKLLEYLVSTYTNEGDIVLDNTAGSGTTGLAAKNLGRNYIMIEKDKNIYNTCVNRLNK